MPLASALLLFAGLALAEPGREELLAAGEKALAQGDAPQAALFFQRAGQLRHAADAEMGLTRAYMQGGEYRRALAFAAHTAGAHPDSAAGKALYAQLLDLGGLTQVAARLAPGPPGSFAPYSPQSASLPKEIRAASSGILLDNGRRALARAEALRGSERAWIRNGLGALSPARVIHRLDEVGLVLLEIERPLDGAGLAAAPRDAFPGSPAFALEFPAAGHTLPAWPLLRAGFIGRERLGIELPPGPRGGPVLDASGQVVGLAVTDAEGRDRLLPLSRLRPSLGDALGPPAADPRRRTVDELYELALGAIVQVIVQE